MNKKTKRILLTALPVLPIATSLACLTSCSSKDVFNGKDAYILVAGEQGPEQHWISSLVKSNICPVEGKEEEAIVDDDGNTYQRKEFNQQIIFNPKLEEIPDNFLYGCTYFNEGIVFNYLNIKKIGNNFLRECPNFNHKLDFPSSLESIGDDFLNGCEQFNQQIILNDNLISIGVRFLSNCKEFSQPIKLPDNIEVIENDFMNTCTNFSASITMPSNLKQIKNNFMRSIENGFSIENLDECTKLEEIGEGFLRNCKSFNPSEGIHLENAHNLSKIENHFLEGCYNMNNTVYFPDEKTSEIFVLSSEEAGLNHNFAYPVAFDAGLTIKISGDNIQSIVDDKTNWPDEFQSHGTFCRHLEKASSV